jgi:hypothetical protein
MGDFAEFVSRYLVARGECPSVFSAVPRSLPRSRRSPPPTMSEWYGSGTIGERLPRALAETLGGVPPSGGAVTRALPNWSSPLYAARWSSPRTTSGVRWVRNGPPTRTERMPPMSASPSTFAARLLGKAHTAALVVIRGNYFNFTVRLSRARRVTPCVLLLAGPSVPRDRHTRLGGDPLRPLESARAGLDRFARKVRRELS